MERQWLGIPEVISGGLGVYQVIARVQTGVPATRLCPLGPKEGEAYKPDPEAKSPSITYRLSPWAWFYQRHPGFASLFATVSILCHAGPVVLCAFMSGPVRWLHLHGYLWYIRADDRKECLQSETSGRPPGPGGENVPRGSVVNVHRSQGCWIQPTCEAGDPGGWGGQGCPGAGGLLS